MQIHVDCLNEWMIKALIYVQDTEHRPSSVPAIAGIYHHSCLE